VRIKGEFRLESNYLATEAACRVIYRRESIIVYDHDIPNTKCYSRGPGFLMFGKLRNSWKNVTPYAGTARNRVKWAILNRNTLLPLRLRSLPSFTMANDTLKTIKDLTAGTAGGIGQVQKDIPSRIQF
jgi:hypothetical protein